MIKYFQDFSRKPFPVQAARVDPSNIEELAEICGGKLMHDGEKEGNFSRDYIKVRVAFPLNEEQTKARIGDWLVKQGRTFKVYKDKPFRSTFENRDGTPVRSNGQQKQDRSSNRPQNKPSPANMPKRVPQVSPPEENQVAEAVESVTRPHVVAEGIEKSEAVEKVSDELADLVTQGASSEELSEKIQESKDILDAEKQPITLEELNSQPGDPRTADDMHREAHERGEV